jgi:hypothetical protein
VDLFHADLLERVNVTRISRSWQVGLSAGICTLVGVVLSVLIFPPTTSRVLQFFALAIVLTIVALYMGYQARYGNRRTPSFEFIDALFFLVNGITWPAVWPALALRFGVPVDPFQGVSPIPTPIPTPSPSALIEGALAIVRALVG